jgi:hypothetical protein
MVMPAVNAAAFQRFQVRHFFHHAQKFLFTPGVGAASTGVFFGKGPAHVAAPQVFFGVGDKVEIKLFHKEDCKPKILNPEVLKPKSTFEVVSMTADLDGTIKWTTKSETGKLAFAIEQFRWNKWVKVGESAEVLLEGC